MNCPTPSFRQRSWAAAAVLVGAWVWCALAPAPLEAAPLSFSAQPSVSEIVGSQALAQPLLPMGNAEPSATERSALAQALVTYSGIDAGSDDTSALEGFLAAYPQSAFRVSLLTNLGLLYRQHSYWSKALSAWEQAWKAGKTETDPAKRLVVDQALSHLAELTARTGRVDDLKALFTEAGDRAVRGPSAERYNSAKESLFLMQDQPTKNFRCGPLAVGQVLQALDPKRAPRRAVHDSVSTDHGTSLAMVNAFAHDQGLDYQIAFRNPGAAVLVPSVVNWKVGHFAALTRETNGRYVVKDQTFSDDFVVSKPALDQEASGYFLVRAGALPAGWRTVSSAEAANIWGKGGATPQANPRPPGSGPGSCGMPVPSVDFSTVNLFLYDTPYFYTTPRGPAVEFQAIYSARDSTPNSITAYPNLGVQWNTNWVAFIVDDPNNQTTTSYGPAGGTLTYTGYGISTPGAFAPQEDAQAILQRTSAQSYVRTFPDGSRQVFGFAHAIGGTLYIFMTESDDPAGNRMLYNYNASTYRLDSVTDAMGNTVNISYAGSTAGAANYFSISQVSDNLGRSASFSYDGTTGQLTGITDMAGLTSTFTNNASDAITTLTTPYGNTTFVENDQGSDRTMVITDPEGASEKIAFKQDMVPPDQSVMDAPNGQPSASGLQLAPTTYAQFRTTYYWDKRAYALSPNDYSKAHLYHFLHDLNGQMADILESEKSALESRIYYNYVGQTSYFYSGGSNRCTIAARLLDDGSTQLRQYAYNALGNLTKAVDPRGRTTTYHYDTNGIDLLAVYQENPSGTTTDDFGAKADLVRAMTYNGIHGPLSSTDAAGQTSHYTYNGYGQPLTVQNAKGETTTYTYSHDDGGGVSDGYLTTITGAAPGATRSFGYDGFNRVSQVTDSEGYAVGITYDATNGIAAKTLNRMAKHTYPDGTYEETDYDRLDPQWKRDRLGRWTQMLYDAERHLTAVVDPMNRVTQYDWCSCGSLEAIIDPNGNRTTWMRDAESRVTAKVYPDNSVQGMTYEASTSRVKYVNDAKGQYTIYAYNGDDSVASVTYASDASGDPLIPPTPGVSYTYDSSYPRLTDMTYGLGTGSTQYTTHYTYNAAGSPGAGQVNTEYEPYSQSTITYSYDVLGRSVGQAINDDPVATTYGYDALGRVSTVTNALDTFTYGYVNNTNRLNTVSSTHGPTTQYAYYPLPSDPRLQTLTNSTASGTISQFGYSYSAVGDILSWTQSNSGGNAQNYDFGYDADSELTSATLQGGPLSTQAYDYDAAGNRISVQNGNSISTETPNNLNQLTGINGGGLARFAGTVSVSSTPSGNKLASVTVGGNPATIHPDGSYESWAQVGATGTTSVPIVATDSNNTTTTKHASISPVAVTAQTYSYDAVGNQTAAGPSGNQVIYGWDAANRLASITQGTDVTQFDYDGLNRRIREKFKGAEIRHWVWLGSDLAEERDVNNNVTKRFFDEGEQISGKNYFFTFDHLGSVRELLDDTQGIHARYNYDSFGVCSSNLIATSPVDSDSRYAGHYYHATSELDLTLFRAYNSTIGRWLSRDWIEESGGINLYAYANNDPTNLYDLDGLDPQTPITKTGNVRLDDDGTGPSHNDPDHQHHLAGGNANADQVPFVVAPKNMLPKGVKPGSNVDIDFNGHKYFCKVKDVGPNNTGTFHNGVGEVSIAQARQMGVPIIETGHGPQTKGNLPITITYHPKPKPR